MKEFVAQHVSKLHLHLISERDFSYTPTSFLKMAKDSIRREKITIISNYLRVCSASCCTDRIRQGKTKMYLFSTFKIRSINSKWIWPHIKLRQDRGLQGNNLFLELFRRKISNKFLKFRAIFNISCDEILGLG